MVVPPIFINKKEETLILKSAHYHLINGIIFRRNYDNVLLRCLEKYDAERVLQELHDGPVGGHFGGDTTTHKFSG
jgi:hypothetical protein